MTDGPRFLAPSQASSVVPDFASPASQPVAPAPAPSIGDVIGANWTLSRQDQVGARTTAEDVELAPIVSRLEQMPDDRPWYDRLTGSRYRRTPVLPGHTTGAFETSYDREAIWRDMAAHPDAFGELPYHDETTFQAYVHGQRAKDRAAAQAVVSRQTGVQQVAGFATGVAAGFTDPINLAGMAATGGAGAAPTLIGGMAREALVNGVLTAVQEPTMIASRREFGEGTTFGQAITEIGEGAVAGAAFHGGIHVAGKAIGALLGRSDRDVAATFAGSVPPGQRTPDQQAALHVVERQADVDATNPFVATPAGMDAHATALNGALQQLATMDVPKPAATATGVTTPTAPIAAAPDLSPSRVIRFVMGDLEGGARVVHYSDADGGTTRYGIAARANPGVDVANLTADQAASIARRKYWLPEYDRADPRTAAVAFDAGYIAGPEVGRRILRDSGGDPARALDLYRGYLDHIADTVPGKERYRKGWNARVDKLDRFVGGSADRLALRPEVFAGDEEGLTSAQRALDEADMANQLDAHDAAMARSDDAGGPDDPATAPPVMEGSGFGDASGYFVPRVEGAAEQVVTPRGRPVDTQFEVREASDIVDSSSPAYDQRLQPRDRAGRSASDVQIARMAGELDPQQLATSRLASQGAPIVGPDGMVESGNGRVAAIRRAYAEHPDRAAAYRAMVQARHPEAATMREPVLVRRRTSDMAPAERRAWVAEANERDTMGMSPAEQAGTDARALTPEAMASYRGGELTDARNRPFVRSFLDQVASPSEVNTLVDKDGVLNADGLRRINRAILARAYDDPALIARLAEAADSNIKAIGEVLTRIAPSMAQLKDMIRAGRIDRQFDLSPALAEVAARVRDARDKGAPIDDVLHQGDMFGGGPDREVAALMRLFFRSDEKADGTRVLARPRSADTVTDALENYITAARQGADFFGHQPTAEELIYAKRAEVAGDDEPGYAASGRAGSGDAGDGAGTPGRGGGAGGDRGQPDDAARDAAEADGLAGPPPLDPHAGGGVDDPAGTEAQAIAASLEHDARAQFAPAGDIEPAHNADTIIAGQRGIDVDEAMRRATENQPQLAALGATLERETGAVWHDPGVKGRNRVEEKIATEGYADAGGLKDIARGALTISDPQQADAIVARLAATHAIYDKGWQRLDSGYIDRKLVVRFENGGVAELQIVPQPVWDVKKAALGALYERSRVAKDSARAALEAQQRDGYAAALAGSDFSGIADRSASGKAAAKAAGDSLTPAPDALPTNPGASRQPDPGLNAQARSPDRATARSSTSNSSIDMEASSPLDIGADGSPRNGDAIDPAIVDRQRQETALQAASPLRGGAEQADTGGLGLFDVADQPGFRLGEDGAERSAADILGEIDTDQSALDAAKGCL